MIENIPLVICSKLSWEYAKPLYTNQMPLISPVIISIPSFNDGFINDVHYFVFDKNCGCVFGSGENKIQAINTAKSLYKKLSTNETLIDYLNKNILIWNQLWDEYELNKKQRFNNVVSIKKEKVKLETKVPKRAIVFKKNDGKCFYCNDQLTIDDEWHIEHKQPKSKGGTNDIENLVPACKSCNLKKHNKTAKEFLEASA
jgi:hypothetical protein